jgi:hypothetical protein
LAICWIDPLIKIWQLKIKSSKPGEVVGAILKLKNTKTLCMCQNYIMFIRLKNLKISPKKTLQVLEEL